MIRKICVYCGSGNGSSPVFMEAATKLGVELAKNGIGLVYGGGDLGLMGAVARSVLNNGGHVTGIIPEFLTNKEKMLHGAQELIITQNMHERKMLMFEKADAFIALPGGIGTLEELVEQMTWSQLDQHQKPVIIANIDNFWQPLFTLLNHMRSSGFIRQGYEVKTLVANNIEDIIPMLQKDVAPELCVTN